MKPFRRGDIDTFEDGEVIVREGEETRDMFIIAEGSVEVLKRVGGHEVTLAVLERGAFFGEMSLLEGLPRSATVRARGKTSLVVVQSGGLLLKIRRDPTFAFEMLQHMSRRIRELNEKLIYTLAASELGSRQARSLLTLSTTAEYRSLDEEPAREEREP